MIAWKRTLGWTRCWTVASAPAAADETGMPVTAAGLRRLSSEGADQMLSKPPAAPGTAAVEDAVPGMETPAPAPARTVRVGARETTGLIWPEVYKASASVVSRVPERILLSQE